MKCSDSGTTSSIAVKDWSGRRGRLGDKIFLYLTFIFALLIVVTLVALLIVLNIDAMPAIQKFGMSFLTSMNWDPVQELFGALPAIYGTLLSSIIALIIAVPISMGSAVFLSELAPAWIREPASFLIEMLAAIPSVIIGLWGLFVLVPFIRSPIEGWLGSHLGFLPLFQGPPFGVGLSGGRYYPGDNGHTHYHGCQPGRNARRPRNST